MWATRVPEGKEKENGAEEICKEITVRNFLKLVRNTTSQIQEWSPPPFSTDPRKRTLPKLKARGAQTPPFLGRVTSHSEEEHIGCEILYLWKIKSTTRNVSFSYYASIFPFR